MNMVFGILPFLAAVLMTQMREDSNQAHLWLTIVHFLMFSVPSFHLFAFQMPLGFGNAVVMQTVFSKSAIDLLYLFDTITEFTQLLLCHICQNRRWQLELVLPNYCVASAR